MNPFRRPLTVVPGPEAAQLDEIYAKLPRIDCRKRCQAFCGATIPMSKVELRRMERLLGKELWFPVHKKPVCPVLDVKTGGCKAYGVRPAICRLWGLTEGMACPHGCVPERWLSVEECHEILEKVEEIGRGRLFFRGVEQMTVEGDRVRGVFRKPPG